jgi:hypothetical protein
MKTLIVVASMLLVAVGCEQQTTNPTVYPPPQVVGYGKAMMFEAQDKHGRDIINESMSAYFRDHQEEQFMGLLAVEHANVNGHQKPTKYIVFAKELNPQPATNPSLLHPSVAPVVNEKGEITYPQ